MASYLSSILFNWGGEVKNPQLTTDNRPFTTDNGPLTTDNSGFSPAGPNSRAPVPHSGAPLRPGSGSLEPTDPPASPGRELWRAGYAEVCNKEFDCLPFSIPLA
jgi:hypothetical protein